MMRLILVTLVTVLSSLTGLAQQTQAVVNPDEITQQPFPPLTPAAQAQLQEVLKKWEQQSQSMKTLECRFLRWHYDHCAAPANVAATKADGVGAAAQEISKIMEGAYDPIISFSIPLKADIGMGSSWSEAH